MIDHVRCPIAQLGAERPHVAVPRVDDEMLDGLAHLAVDLSRNDLRARDLKLVALTAERFDQDSKMQLPATRHEEHVGGSALFHPEGDIRLQLAEKARANLA